MTSHTAQSPNASATGADCPARRRGSAALAVTSLVVAAPLAILAVGAIFPRIPVLGVLGSFTIPTVAPWAFVLALVGILLAALALRAGRRRLTRVAAAMSALALLGTGTVFGTHVVLAHRAGVPLGPQMFSMQLASDGHPDESLTYLTDPTGAALRMDVYKPAATAGKGAPVMVYVHGGGWNSGEPDETAATLRWFADQGYLVLAPQYTLASAQFPTWNIAMPQVGCALIWAGEHATSLGGDSSRLAVFGGSAGGNLALTTTYAAAAGTLTPACEGTVPKVSAVAAGVPAVDPAYVYDTRDPLMKGYTQQLVRDFLGGTPDEHPDRLTAVQVRTYLTPKAPPTFFGASVGDHIVPVEGTSRFEQEARDAGVDITAHYIPFSDHLTPVLNHGLTGETLRLQIRDFFREHGV
ncbi:alpha/beta hydrolase [Actinomyces slackii]|uniref:Acetyl esterase n=1 Tax=Actinomyces slackii TaxID=52774 RepID=A0A3S4SUR4_9ACTO|nr:alpha/beta hydrolase [Actinomyces slackii]VEG75561.1 acetyl esterase [Actinomyces slackii]